MHLFGESLEVLGFAQARKSRFAGGIEPLLECHTLFESRHGLVGFLQLRICRRDEKKNRAAVGRLSEEFLSGRQLRLKLLVVGDFLREDARRKCSGEKKQEEQKTN